jgi:hypothetical protein
LIGKALRKRRRRREEIGLHLPRKCGHCGATQGRRMPMPMAEAQAQLACYFSLQMSEGSEPVYTAWLRPKSA